MSYYACRVPPTLLSLNQIFSYLFLTTIINDLALFANNEFIKFFFRCSCYFSLSPLFFFSLLRSFQKNCYPILFLLFIHYCDVCMSIRCYCACCVVDYYFIRKGFDKIVRRSVIPDEWVMVIPNNVVEMQ
mmetsp:Transcript_61263/g.69428  ORF Transcript_61263/g.69428 Transcript_61263/m.69428 type:complete len:130 (+) Transcript_61263:129-518(+)